MTCAETRDILLLALYGEADEPSARAAREHVRRCRACADEDRSLAEARRLVVTAEGRAGGTERPGPRRIAVLAVAATLVLATLAALVGVPGGRGPSGPPTSVVAGRRAAATSPVTGDGIDSEIASLADALDALESSAREF